MYHYWNQRILKKRVVKEDAGRDFTLRAAPWQSWGGRQWHRGVDAGYGEAGSFSSVGVWLAGPQHGSRWHVGRQLMLLIPDIGLGKDWHPNADPSSLTAFDT